jgi:preprotein translocase subunit Sss1
MRVYACTHTRAITRDAANTSCAKNLINFQTLWSRRLPDCHAHGGTALDPTCDHNGFVLTRPTVPTLYDCPDSAEYFQLLSATGTGFAMVGFFGFFIRLIFIPIVRILCH